MKQVNVKVAYKPWNGEHQVPLAESVILITHHLEVNGHYVWPDQVELDLESGILLSVKPGLNQESYQKLRDYFNDPADYMEDTTDELLILPVSTIEFFEMVDNRVFA